MSATDSEREFEHAADAELSRLLAKLEGLGFDFEVELQMGILTIEFPDGTKYVINSHRAAKQIWMAAERSAWHFDHDGGRWVAKKTGDELALALAAAVSKKVGRPVDLR
jgi:iron-sulfur cluster assembly protein CyaY